MELWNPTAKATADRKLFIGYFVDLIIVKQLKYNNRSRHSTGNDKMVYTALKQRGLTKLIQILKIKKKLKYEHKFPRYIFTMCTCMKLYNFIKTL